MYLTLSGEEDLAGLPADLVASARQAASARELPEGSHIITLSRSLVEPFITFSERRDLREKAWRLWTSRGELAPERDNLAIASQILELRVEQARMHGYETYAHFATADTMAGHPDKVMELLERVWQPAKKSVDAERRQLEKYILEHEGEAAAVTATAKEATSSAHKGGGSNSDGEIGIKIEPWDWRHYAEKVRQRSFDLDDSEVKPYFPLDRMVEAIFDVAGKLFGLSFVLRPDITTYHPDVQVYEVHGKLQGDSEEELVAIFLHDNFARPNKRSGAWMSEYRCQTRNTSPDATNRHRVVPIIVNNNNFNKGTAEEPTLLSFDDARTLFHEFGHGLHGMLSDVTYRRLAGTSVLRDFVELPSQLYEHWLSQPVVLKQHARHYRTGHPIPEALLDKVMSASKFNQGFHTVEYTASALVDVALHRHTTATTTKDTSSAEVLVSAASASVATAAAAAAAVVGTMGVDGKQGILDFEKQELARLGMPQGIVMRHRPAHFQRKCLSLKHFSVSCDASSTSYSSSCSLLFLILWHVLNILDLFAGSGYASAYYVYLWAEVLDAGERKSM